MVTIIPAILATTPDQFKADLEKINRSPSLEQGWLHCDFADGEFVKNKSVGVEVFNQNKISLNLEVHLMVLSPDEWFIKLQQFNIKRVIVHIEVDSQRLQNTIKACKDSGVELGLAIKMETSLEKLEPYWDIIDLVLIMSIEPGFQGQPFKEGALERVKEVKRLREKQGFKFKIGVDGHINDSNIKEAIEAGADNLVVGSYLLNGDIEENVEKLWEKINS